MSSRAPGTPAFTLADLASLVGGQVLGAGETVVEGVADPAAAGPHDLVFLLDAKYAKAVKESSAGCVLAEKAIEGFDRPQLLVSKPRIAMARILARFAPPLPYTGIHPTAVVDPTAVLEPGVALGPHVTVGAHAHLGARCQLHAGVAVGRHVSLGPDCLLYPHVVLYDGVQLGARVILHAGTVVGSDGYGFTPGEQAPGAKRPPHLKIPQLGNVILGDDVETGANVAIDRGTLGPTVIGRGTKLDNLVHIGHNDQIGEDVLIVSQAGLSGSVTVEDGVTLAGQVGVAGHLTIGEGSWVLARGGVTKSLPAGSFVSGFPARPHKEELKRQAGLGELASLKAGLVALQAEVARLRSEVPSLEAQPYDR